MYRSIGIAHSVGPADETQMAAAVGEVVEALSAADWPLESIRELGRRLEAGMGEQIADREYAAEVMAAKAQVLAGVPLVPSPGDVVTVTYEGELPQAFVVPPTMPAGAVGFVDRLGSLWCRSCAYLRPADSGLEATYAHSLELAGEPCHGCGARMGGPKEPSRRA
jgi:hypothetical protein